MELGTLISIALYFVLMLSIGLFAYRQANASAEGYLLGGRKLSAKVTALSAGASDMSGWMLMGLPGAIYVSGISASWIAVGLVVGAYLNYLLVAPRLRVFTQSANNAITIPDYLSNRFNDSSHHIRILASLVIILFFTLYTSSGIVAGGKLFESAFGLSYTSGMLITTGVVVAYTLLGGFMAVSLTDFVQGCIMLVALVLVPIVVCFELNGFGNTLDSVQQLNTSMLAVFTDASTGKLLSAFGIVSLLAWGLGYFGQPHILVRFMAIRSALDLPKSRRIGMSWMIVSLAGALSTGLFGYAYINNSSVQMQDAETIFILLSQILFHPLIAGFLLAAILAAIMSTISSQLLVTSSSLARDTYQAVFAKSASETQIVSISRVSVVLVAIVAIGLASNRDSTILSLVGNAWAGFGAAFGPVIICSLYWRQMSRIAALAGMLVGAFTVVLWISLPLQIGGQTLSQWVYEIIPGFSLSFLTIFVVSKLFPQRDNASVFDDAIQVLESTRK